MCIKGVVFATFWQNAILQALADVDFIEKKSASQIQNLLICIEMLIAALAHVSVFPPEEWHDGWRTADKAKNLLQEGLALKEFAQDFKQLYQPWDKLGVERQLSSTGNSNLSNRGRSKDDYSRHYRDQSNQESDVLDSGDSNNPKNHLNSRLGSTSEDYGSISGSGGSPLKTSQRSEIAGLFRVSGHGSKSWEDFLDGHNDTSSSPDNNSINHSHMHGDNPKDEYIAELETDEEHPENAKLLQYALSEAAKALEQQGQIDAYGRPFNIDNDDDLADVARRSSQIEASTELVRDVLQRMKGSSNHESGGVEGAIRGDVDVSPTAHINSRSRSSSVEESDMAHF